MCQGNRRPTLCDYSHHEAALHQLKRSNTNQVDLFVCVCRLTLFNPLTIAHQAFIHGIFRREYRSGLPCSSSQDLPDPGWKLHPLVSHWQADLPLSHLGSPYLKHISCADTATGNCPVELWTTSPQRDPMEPHGLYHQKTVGFKVCLPHSSWAISHKTLVP